MCRTYTAVVRIISASSKCSAIEKITSRREQPTAEAGVYAQVWKKKPAAQALLVGRTLGRDVHCWGRGRLPTVGGISWTGWNALLSQLTLPTLEVPFLHSFAFRWSFDPLGKLSISHNFHFPSLSLWSKESLYLVLGAMRLCSLWSSPRGLLTSFLAIIAYFLLPCTVHLEGGAQKETKDLFISQTVLNYSLPYWLLGVL